MPVSPDFRPSVRHEGLGPAFYDVVSPASFPRHILRYRNDRAARSVGLETLTDDEWIAHFAMFEPLPGSFAAPLALRYHGHQFRAYNPDLGDGRGFLFAQMHDLGDGRLLDLGTKGSGRTPWSRGADGRLTLKGGVREVLATTMLEALGVDTSKSFSLVETGEQLERHDEPSPTRAAVLVRLSHSHIRIGTFQRLLYTGDTAAVAGLVDHCISTYMPQLWRDTIEERCVAFLEEVCTRVAQTGARWMAAGFVHGVLNTDNINITGESFDYGPWRFLPVLDPAFTAAYFDEGGLYAFGRQPDALWWNLTRLAECLLPHAPQDRLESTLKTFERALHRAFTGAVLDRLGLLSRGAEADGNLVSGLWSFLRESKAPYEQAFFDLFGGRARADRLGASPSASFYELPGFAAVREEVLAFDPDPAARLDHPYFARATACTLLIDEVEALWKPIADRDEWWALRDKLAEIEEMGDAYGAH